MTSRPYACAGPTVLTPLPPTPGNRDRSASPTAAAAEQRRSRSPSTGSRSPSPAARAPTDDDDDDAGDEYREDAVRRLKIAKKKRTQEERDEDAPAP